MTEVEKPIEENELESDEEARPRKKALEDQECNDEAGHNRWDSDVEKPTKERTQLLKHEDSLDEERSVSSLDEDKPTTEASSGNIISQIGFWEANLDCSESTDVIQSAMESNE